jgi:hypothetical protein
MARTVNAEQVAVTQRFDELTTNITLSMAAFDENAFQVALAAHWNVSTTSLSIEHLQPQSRRARRAQAIDDFTLRVSVFVDPADPRHPSITELQSRVDTVSDANLAFLLGAASLARTPVVVASVERVVDSTTRLSINTATCPSGYCASLAALDPSACPLDLPVSIGDY